MSLQAIVSQIGGRRRALPTFLPLCSAADQGPAACSAKSLPALPIAAPSARNGTVRNDCKERRPHSPC